MLARHQPRANPVHRSGLGALAARSCCHGRRAYQRTHSQPATQHGRRNVCPDLQRMHRVRCACGAFARPPCLRSACAPLRRYWHTGGATAAEGHEQTQSAHYLKVRCARRSGGTPRAQSSAPGVAAPVPRAWPCADCSAATWLLVRCRALQDCGLPGCGPAPHRRAAAAAAPLPLRRGSATRR